MRRIVLASAAALFAVGVQGASAADMPAAISKAPVMVPVAFTWTGFYIGGNLGDSWSAGDLTYTQPFAGSVATNNNGSSVVGGGQIGYNWQTGVAVWGL